MKLSPRVLLVISAASGGGTWVAAPWALADLPPLTVAFGRFALAAVLLFGWCRWRGLSIDARLGDLPIILGVAATSVVGYNLLFLNGVRLAPASHGAVIVPGFIPVITLGLTSLVFRERVSPRQVAGALVALGGLVLVIGPAFAAGSDELLGDAMFVGGAVVWSVYTIIGRAATRRFNPSVITFLAAAVGTAAFFGLSIAFEPGGLAAYAAASPRALSGVAYLGSIGTVVSFVTFYVGVQRIGAARAAAFAVLIPLFGVAATVTLLGESLEPPAIAGAAVVIAGLWLMQAPPGASPRAAQGVGSPAQTR
jgi:drug/metabolite transporter (DMT)-like permease